MPASAIQTVFQAIVVAKLSCVSPVWWGFASMADRNRLESFLRRSVCLGYRDSIDETETDTCDRADDLAINYLTLLLVVATDIFCIHSCRRSKASIIRSETLS